MPIEWVFPGATTEQKQRAGDAALKVFEAGGIPPEVAAFARMEMQVFMGRNERGPRPHAEAPKAALIFIEAQHAAAAATGAPDDALDRGYIAVDIPEGSWAAHFIEESDVLNWVDPAGPATSPA